MINSLQLENYRGFKRYEIKPIGRVNLLVGANNCGKTSILEAINLLATDGSITVIAINADRRGEIIYKSKDSMGSSGTSGQMGATGASGQNSNIGKYFQITHIFHGHELHIDNSIRIVSDKNSVKISYSDSLQAEIIGGSRIIFPEVRVSGFGLMIIVNGKESSNLFIDNDGSLVHDASEIRYITAREFKSPSKDIGAFFIGLESLKTEFMREIWDLVTRAAQESNIIDVMRIINPDLVEIVPLIYQPGFLVSLKEFNQRVPLGSLGDGMQRLLALALALFRSNNGILLIDEIDTGLHYSVMGDMWRVVVEAAVQNNIQVFATTHSQDCVNGLHWLCENHPELKKEVYLHKIDQHMKKAVSIDGDEILKTLNFGIEVR